MRSLRTAMILAVIIVAVISSSAAADEWFIHEHKQYWWYYVDNPGFYAVVPNTAERYYKKTIFGYQFLEMSWENGSIVMQIGIIPKSSVNEAVSFVAKRWSPLLENELVFANREITTSNGLKTYFYAVEGVGLDGVKSMLRSVYFSKEGTIVYLAMFIPSSKYEGTMLNNWIKAVNEFEWE